jgi:uncharacterized DUF497 family protein
MMDVAGFDWDAGNRAKCQKHGVSIAEIEEVFTGDPTIRPDPAHSRAEDRFYAIGTSHAGRKVFLIFTFRERGGTRLIRPISARYMHRKEIERYEKETSDP